MIRHMIWVSGISILDKAAYMLHDYTPLMLWICIWGLIGLAALKRA